MATVKYKTAKKTFQQMKYDCTSIYNAAVHFNHTHDEILERQSTQVFNHSDYALLTRYEREYLRGMIDAQLSAMYHHLRWAHVYDGQYCIDLPFHQNFKQELVQKSYHHYKGKPDKPF